MIARILAVAILAAATLDVAAEPIVFLAPHAEKTEDAADPKNPELSPAGRARAERLARMLRDAGVVAIFATEYTRTQQTAEQVGRVTGAEVTVLPAKDTRLLVERLEAVDGKAVVIAHSNTLPDIIKMLGAEMRVAIGDDEYDCLFLWTRSSTRELIHLRYEPALRS